MNKYKMFAVCIASKQFSEIIQRIAFSFDYKWIVDGANIHDYNETHLCFDPNTKIITWIDDSEYVKNTLKATVVSSIIEFTELCKNPTEVEKRVVGCLIAFNDGSVLANEEVVESYEFERFVKERNEFLGVLEAKKTEKGNDVKRKLSKVTFLYNSKTSGLKWREIAVVEMNDEVVSGYDLNDKNRYKKFLRNRIHKDGYTGKESGIQVVGIVEV